MSGAPGRSSASGPGDGDATVENFLPQAEHEHSPRQPVLRRNQKWPARMIQRFGEIELSYRNCCVWFGILACGMALVPIKDYILGSYVTQTFDEVRDDLVARKLDNFDAVTSTVHYYDTFARDSLPLFDTLNQTRMTRNGSRTRTLIDFLVYTSVSRADLYTVLPETLLNTTVSVMDDFYAPICGPASQTGAQLLFGNYFPAIHHEFCREFGDKFPRERFFVKASGSGSSPLTSLEYVAPLGVIGLVNMSEVYLRHFRSVEVVRTLARSVLSGFLGDENASLSSWQVNFSDETANMIVARYAGGITIAEAISLLPGASNVATDDHVRLIDLVGMKPVLAYFLTPQVLSMGLNLNAEDAVQAEISYATVSVLSLDYLVTILGMGPVFPTYMAPFWNCGIELTTMSKDVAVESLDPAQFYRCGFQKASILPAYIVNLLYLTQKSFRDYAKLDNTSLFVVGPNRAVAFDVPEKLVNSPLLLIDGTAWSKANNLQIQQPIIPSTPYGYLYTRDCKHLVDAVFTQQGRNVQKYQAYIGDGLGDCRFHDSQETELQVLCRLVFRVDEILLRDLDGNVHSNISACSDLAPLASLEQQSNFRQIEWFLIDTTTLAKRTRIRDNTSRQIRTFLLLLSLIGLIYYVAEYLTILKSLMVFIRNSLGVPQVPNSFLRAPTIRMQEFTQFDPAVGALQHPITIVLIYLGAMGAVGALSNTFSLGCHAEIASDDGTIAIFCRPSIAITSVWLLFTVLSSGFWIALITQQTQKIGRRLRSHADPNWVRKWMLSHCAVLVIYLICKASTDLVLENVMLRSDPHLYAICGGLFLSFLISMAFRIVHYSHRRSSPDKVISGDAAVPNNRRHLVRFPSFSAHDTTAQEQNVLSRWSSTHLDGVLQQCASPTIALQLIWYCSMKRSYEDVLMPQSASKYQSALVASSSFRIHEFVALHTAAGAWTHLETLAWRYDDTRTTLLVRRVGLKALEKKVGTSAQSKSKAGTATVIAT